MDRPTTLEALLRLIGTWEGFGTIEFPTLETVPYREVLEIQEGRNGQYLHYLQHTWRQEDGREIGSHHETGFITTGVNGTIRILSAQGSDRVEILHGDVSSKGGVVAIELTSIDIAGDDRMIRSWRSLQLDGEELAYTMGMATTQVPEGAIHLTARLNRR